MIASRQVEIPFSSSNGRLRGRGFGRLRGGGFGRQRGGGFGAYTQVEGAAILFLPSFFFPASKSVGRPTFE